MRSASEVLDVAEDLDSLPYGIEALDLGRGDHATHLECGEGKGKQHHVEDVDQDDVEEPAHHIVMGVEDVEHQQYHCHHKEH